MGLGSRSFKDMNIADVISWQVNTDELVHKFESDALRLGSQLIVYPSQTAFFVKGGVIADEFQSGTHTIKSENIPILGKLLNKVFNDESPFKAEVWFVNQVSILDCKWGTANNIHAFKIVVNLFNVFLFFIINCAKNKINIIFANSDG